MSMVKPLDLMFFTLESVNRPLHMAGFELFELPPATGAITLLTLWRRFARARWECYVIEGVEAKRFAILLKVHHALIDGLGGMKLFEKSLNTRANSREFKHVWQPHAKRSRSRNGSESRAPSFAQLVPGIQKTAPAKKPRKTATRKRRASK